MKAEAEAQKINVELKTDQLIGALDNLERLVRLASVMAHVTFEQHGNDGHLLIGPRPEQLGLPAGDESSSGTSPCPPTKE